LRPRISLTPVPSRRVPLLKDLSALGIVQPERPLGVSAAKAADGYDVHVYMAYIYIGGAAMATPVAFTAMKEKTQAVKIGAAIRKLREGLGVTQDDFADKIEMHRSYYGEIERGKWNLTLRTITKGADGLGVKMWEMFRAADL
jgi:DNA-binding XRE family transcriptional regulator